MSSLYSLKTEALCWLRYGKRMPIVCTEAGRWSADVLGIGPTMSIEVEVKASLSDLKRDFKNKYAKHWSYDNATPETATWVPNYFYFFVPESMAEAAASVLAESGPKIGLCVRTETDLLAGRNIRIFRKPRQLWAGKPSPKLVKAACARMSSELCGSKLTLEQIRNQLMDKFDTAVATAASASARCAGTLDCEDPELELLVRAQQLALAVTGKGWADVDENEWKGYARRYLEIQNLQQGLDL